MKQDAIETKTEKLMIQTLVKIKEVNTKIIISKITINHLNENIRKQGTLLPRPAHSQFEIFE